MSGTVTVTMTSSTAGTLVEDITGLAPRTMSVLWLQGGACGSSAFGVARVRWTVPASGHLRVTAQLSPAMVGWFNFDMAHRGGVHATMTDGSAIACSALARA